MNHGRNLKMGSFTLVLEVYLVDKEKKNAIFMFSGSVNAGNPTGSTEEGHHISF